MSEFNLSKKRKESIIKLARSSLRWSIKVYRFVNEVEEQDKEFIRLLKGSINQIPIPNSREKIIMALVHECINKLAGDLSK